MNETEIKELVSRQRNYFLTGETLPVEARLEALKKLKKCIQEQEKEINEALKADLGKGAFESYMCETGLVLSELSYMIKNTPAYASEQTVPTPMAQFSSRSYRKPSPYGVVLIMSPWNYPFLLSIDPLVDAIAAGNTAIVKPSAYSPNTSRVIERSSVSALTVPTWLWLPEDGRKTPVFSTNISIIYFLPEASM